MSEEDHDSSVANMDIDDNKIAYKRLLMDPDKLRFSGKTLENSVSSVIWCTLTFVIVTDLLVIQLFHYLFPPNFSLDRNMQQENLNKLQSVNTEKDSLQTSLSSLQREKRSLDEKQRELEKSLEVTRKRRDQIQENYNSLAEQTYTLRQSETKLKSSNAALTKDLQQANATVVKLQIDKTTISTAKDLLQAKLDQAVKLKTTLEGNYKSLSIERNNLQNSFNNVTRRKDQLQLSYNSLMMDVESLEKRLHLTTIEKDTAEASHMDAATARNTLKDMYNILLKATEQLNSSYMGVLKEKQELEKSCGSGQVERSSLMEKIENLTKGRDELQLEVIKLNGIIAAKKCPTGWRSHMYSCYYTSETKKNWKNSREYCKNKGADLAVITSQEEMVFINGLYSSDKEVWIGLSDDGIEGHWTWVDGTPITEQFWGNGQPNSYDGRNQDCVEFWHRATGHGEWNDESCKIEQFWICEM
uniref:C-type lectin domain-containing protein n=1 Tax=Periophthalmus magnuspinnatus TaxID=409849 RepID=A0A3B3ZU32_9GOBI